MCVRHKLVLKKKLIYIVKSVTTGVDGEIHDLHNVTLVQ